MKYNKQRANKKHRFSLLAKKRGSILAGESIVDTLQWIIFIIVALVVTILLVKYLSQ